MKESASEEIDLGQLFLLLGNAVNKLVGVVRNFFKSLFYFFILFLQFLRVHFVKFIIALCTGVGVGALLDYMDLPVYRSSMIIEPNFNSAQQLYNSVQFYNQLAEQKESKILAEALEINEKEASYIKMISIESFSDETQRIKQFSEFISELDSISQKQVDYEDYLTNFNDINAKFHKIQIEATSPEVAKKCQKSIVTSVENNEYFRLQREVNDSNLLLKDSVIKTQQGELNNLLAFYKELKIIEAKKPEGSTSISFSESEVEQTSDIEILNHARELKDEIIELNQEKANTKNTINIISEFPNRGALIDDMLQKKVVLMPMLFICILFVILSIISLNKYLVNYERKLN
ncbi:hypothetical protein [Aquimarina pacifica]|uniref:hypothetical protein n=1 Tax=Aquimarina pacifica TaxID=1296415 RepID=UPI00046EBD58|nr:hypothetical protein [Aquimarina pacifica]